MAVVIKYSRCETVSCMHDKMSDRPFFFCTSDGQTLSETLRDSCREKQNGTTRNVSSRSLVGRLGGLRSLKNIMCCSVCRRMPKDHVPLRTTRQEHVNNSVNCWTCNTDGHVTKTVRRRKQNLSATCQQDHNDATMSGFFLNTVETNNLNRLQSSTSMVLITGIDSGAGLGCFIIQDTWSGRVCTSSTATASRT